MSAHESDPYFAKADDVLKSYVIDYEKYEEFALDVMFNSLMANPCLCCMPCVICDYCLFQKPNTKDLIRAQHVAITRDGIKFVTDRHKTACRLQCQEQGRVSKTVPFDKITDCDVEEPAGASGPCCCLVQNVLYYVNVDTASTPPGGHELHMAGIKDPHQFKKDVWAMKRGEAVDGVPSTQSSGPAILGMSRNAGGGKSGGGGLFGAAGGGGGGRGEELAPLLKEQTGLLRDIAAAIREQTAAMAK